MSAIIFGFFCLKKNASFRRSAKSHSTLLIFFFLVHLLYKVTLYGGLLRIFCLPVFVIPIPATFIYITVSVLTCPGTVTLIVLPFPKIAHAILARVTAGAIFSPLSMLLTELVFFYFFIFYPGAICRPDFNLIFVDILLSPFTFNVLFLNPKP